MSGSASRIAWWAVGCVAVGWLVVYNVLRLRGDYPSEAAAPALIGAAAGAVVFASGFVAARRMRASGRVLWGTSDDAARPAEGAYAEWRAAAVVLLVAADASLVVGALLARDYAALSAPRPRANLLLIAWDLVFALWAGEEAVRVLRSDPDLRGIDASGFDAVWFACLLTAVLAGVAFSRDLLPALHVVLVALSGLAGAAVALALWRHRGASGVPWAVAWAVLVAAASIAAPVLI